MNLPSSRVHWSQQILDDTTRNLVADQLGCDPGDQHVLAAAIAAKAEVIALDLAPGAIHGCLETIAARQRNPARTAQALLQILSRQAPTFASRCMEFQIDTN